MANLTVIGLYFSLETVIFAFYGKFPIRMRMSPYSTHNVRLDLFIGFVSEMDRVSTTCDYTDLGACIVDKLSTMWL